jgi:hypothetical protein
MKGISRSKDHKGEFHKFFRRMILTCPQDITDGYNEIKRLCSSPSTTYRIYLSLNARDVSSTNYRFVQDLILIAYGVSKGTPDMLVKSKRLSSEWKTELEQTRNRGTKRMLLDIDDKSMFNDVMEYINTEMSNVPIYAVRETPNGYAVVLEGCDTRGLMAKFGNGKLDIQRDSMLFLEQFVGVL